MVWSAVSVTINMNKNIKKYWKSEIELTDSSKVETLRNNEFVDKLPVDDILSDKNSLENFPPLLVIHFLINYFHCIRNCI